MRNIVHQCLMRVFAHKMIPFAIGREEENGNGERCCRKRTWDCRTPIAGRKPDPRNPAADGLFRVIRGVTEMRAAREKRSKQVKTAALANVCSLVIY
jgi:hypothetical protein